MFYELQIELKRHEAFTKPSRSESFLAKIISVSVIG